VASNAAPKPRGPTDQRESNDLKSPVNMALRVRILVGTDAKRLVRHHSSASSWARYYAANVLDPDGYSLEAVYKSWQHPQP
jgi:hypothetical protein